MENKIIIGITHGDFNGVGYEVILKTLADKRMLELMTPVVYGCGKIWSYYADLLRIKVEPDLLLIDEPEKAQEGKINFIEIGSSVTDVKVEPGQPSEMAGQLAAEALLSARKHLMEGKLDAVVTAPINKATIQSKRFSFNGHTEFFSEPFEGQEPSMLFVAGDLKVALLTMHMPLSQVPKQVTPARLAKGILRLENTLKQDFGVVKPRIAVLGLNPHSGEDGLLGNEENNLIEPTIEDLWESGKLVFGPFPADGYWGSASYRQFDATLALYHDQGLIPFKLLASFRGVNVTGNLPIIRTSPDHGTAYDLAGKGEAREDSFRNAIYQAIDIYKNRKIYQEATNDPLQKRFVERGRDNVKLDLSKSVDEE